MLRFASSPTGDMHINDLRIALFNYLLSAQKTEELIVRIEDAQREKNIEGKDQEILDILDLFAIKHSQVIYQSQNARFHAAMALQLLHEKKAFSCFCSSEWLEKKQAEAKAANQSYHYDDACRNLPAELVIDNTAPFTVRVARPDKEILLNDKIKGLLRFDPDNVDSFVILNQDKTATYNFASAIDDMLSDISTVIQSDDQLQNTPKQIHVRNQLGYEKEIEYAHIPTLLNASDNTLSVKTLLKEGYLPEAISNYLISIGNSTPCEIFTLNEAQEWFNLEKLSDSPAHFDIERLKDINREHLKRMDAVELSRYVGFADAEIGELARLYLDEVSTTRELKDKIAPVFESRNIPKAYEATVKRLSEIIKAAPYFEVYSEFKEYIIQKSDNIDEKEMNRSLYILLTNREDGPDLKEIYKHLKNYIGEIIK